MQEQTTPIVQEVLTQEVPETVSKTVKISMTKEQATSWLSGVFNTPTSVIPTEQFPELIKANLGLDVPEKFLGAFIMQMLNKNLTSRPRKQKPIEEPKPKREKSIKELFFQFADTDVEVVSIKKEKPVEEVVMGTPESTKWQTTANEGENEASVAVNPNFYTGSLGVLNSENGTYEVQVEPLSEELKDVEVFGETGIEIESPLNTTEEDVNW
jgi:hypothetical protein